MKYQKMIVLYSSLLYNTFMDSKYNFSKNIMYLCRYHVVWCTKYRRKVLEGEVGERLMEVVKSICEEYGIVIMNIRYAPDHVYLHLEVNPQYGIHKAIKTIKGKSSRVLREEFSSLRTRMPTLWTNSYFVSTLNEEPLEDIVSYICIQKKSQRN